MVYPHGGPFATQFSHRLPISVPWSGSCSLDDERHHNVSVRSPSLCLSSVSHSGTSLLEGQGSTSLDDSHRPQVALSTVVHGSLRAVLCCSFPASSEAGPPCTAEIFDQPESHGLRAPLLCGTPCVHQGHLVSRAAGLFLSASEHGIGVRPSVGQVDVVMLFQWHLAIGPSRYQFSQFLAYLSKELKVAASSTLIG